MIHCVATGNDQPLFSSLSKVIVMLTMCLRFLALGLCCLFTLGGCSLPPPAPTIGQLLPGNWELAGKPDTQLTMSSETETSGRFTLTHGGLFPSTFGGHWTLRGRVLTMQIDTFPPAAQWVVPLTGQQPASLFIQDIVRVNNAELVLRVQGQSVEERYERTR